MTMKLIKLCISLSLIALGAMLYGHADTQRTVARVLANPPK